MQKTILLALLLACGNVHAVTPKEEQPNVDHYNMLWKYDMMATGDAYFKLGQRLRVATALKECKLEALADTVAPKEDQIDQIIVQYLRRQPDGESVFWEVRAAVMSALYYYRTGFAESVAPMHAGMGEKFCQDTTQLANDVLGEPKGEK